MIEEARIKASKQNEITFISVKPCKVNPAHNDVNGVKRYVSTNQCYICRTIYYNTNKDKIAKVNREWAKNNKERTLAYQRSHYYKKTTLLIENKKLKEEIIKLKEELKNGK